MTRIEIIEDEKQIKRLSQTTNNENKKIRLDTLLLKKVNPTWSNTRIATEINANRRTVERWFSLYETGGIKGLCKTQRMGSRLRKTLSEEQQNELKIAIESGKVQSYQDARVWILMQCGIAMPYKNATMFISKQMGISLSASRTRIVKK
jgi:transposase